MKITLHRILCILLIWLVSMFGSLASLRAAAVPRDISTSVNSIAHIQSQTQLSLPKKQLAPQSEKPVCMLCLAAGLTAAAGILLLIFGLIFRMSWLWILGVVLLSLLVLIAITILILLIVGISGYSC